MSDHQRPCPRCNGTGIINTRMGRPPTLDPKHHDTIRQRLSNGEQGVALAAEYGVTPSTISRIRRDVGPRLA